MLAISIAIAACALFGDVAPAAAQGARTVVKAAPEFPGYRFGKPVRLSLAGSTLAKGRRIKTIVIDWGDRKTSRTKRFSAKPVHRYRNPGQYTIKVTVTDSRRRRATGRTVVIVSPKAGLTRRSSTVVASADQILEVRTTSDTTKVITFAPGSRITVGKVIVAEANPALPEGLLQRVTAVAAGPGGSIVAQTTQSSMDQAYSYWSISRSGTIGTSQAFVLPNGVPDVYRPQATMRRMRLTRHRQGLPTGGFGALTKALFDCKAGGYADTPFKLDLGIQPFIQDIKFDVQNSPFGKTLRLHGPMALRFFAGLAMTGGCQVSDKVQVPIPIPGTPLLVVFRPVAGLTATGTLDLSYTLNLQLDASITGKVLPPGVSDPKFSLVKKSDALDVRGDINLEIFAGFEAALGIGSAATRAEGGIRAVAALDGRLYAFSRVVNGSAIPQVCGLLRFGPEISGFVAVYLPPALDFAYEKVVGFFDGISDAIKRKLKLKKFGPENLPAVPKPKRFDTPAVRLGTLQIFPQPGQPACKDLGGGSPTPTPTPTASPSPSPSPTATPSPTPTPTPVGRPVAWGFGGGGELGNGKTDNSNVPVDVSGNLTDTTQVAAGLSTSYALTAAGRVYAWGSNDRGQLGDGGADANGTTVPVEVPLPGGLKAKQIAAGKGAGAYALLSDGTIAYWGDDQHGQAGDGEISAAPASPAIVSGISGAKSIAAGASNGYAIAADDTIKAWGSNLSGEIGNGTVGPPQPTPVTVLMTGTPPLERVAQVSGGFNWALAVTQSGLVYAWGDNSRQQLGTDAAAQQLYATRVGTLTDMVQVAAGYDTSYARAADGAVWSWGNNDFGQLGDGSAAPMRAAQQKIPALTGGIVDIAGGGYTGYARRADGGVLAWGSNAAGQIGNGTGDPSPTPVAVSGLKAIAIAGGPSNALAVRSP